MTLNALSAGKTITLIRKSASPVFGRVRKPSERASEITENEAEQHRKNDYDEEMEV